VNFVRARERKEKGERKGRERRDMVRERKGEGVRKKGGVMGYKYSQKCNT
jgi:hypothetical protein